MARVRCYHARVNICALSITVTNGANAAHCDGASHISCHEGIDQSGRSPGALYDAAVEGLRESRMGAERDLARRAMKDAFDPAMSNPRAVECNQASNRNSSFAVCMTGSGPAPGLKMSIPCQQNLDDGRLLVNGPSLPTGAHYKVTRYQPRSNETGWSYGVCEVTITRQR